MLYWLSCIEKRDSPIPRRRALPGRVFADIEEGDRNRISIHMADETVFLPTPPIFKKGLPVLQQIVQQDKWPAASSARVNVIRHAK